MSELADAVRALVALDRRSPAVLVQRPDGGYHVSSNGHGGGSENLYIISRAQVRELMLTERMTEESLADPSTSEQLATIVNSFHRSRHRDEPPTDRPTLVAVDRRESSLDTAALILSEHTPTRLGCASDA